MALIEAKVLSRLLSLLKDSKHRPQGINLMDISLEYYKAFGKRLNPTDYNCKSIYELCHQLAQQCNQSVVVFDQNQKSFQSDRIFFDEKAYKHWIRTFQTQQNVLALETLVDHSLPQDVVRQHSNQLPAIQLPPNAWNKEKMESFVAELIHIESPNLMFIRLKNYCEIYRNLKQSMRFYDGKEIEVDDYVLPPELAVVGYLCAAQNPNDWDNWHRAVITGVFQDMVTLFAIDFGNVFTEDISQLRLLKDSLFVYPPQVIRVSLTGIAPIGYDVTEVVQTGSFPLWTEESIEFIEKVQESYNILGCLFIEALTPDYFAVVIHYNVLVVKEDIPEQLPVYLHEKLIRAELAQMIPYCWSSVVKRWNLSTPSQPICEPLLAIKCEADFDKYEAPVGGDVLIKAEQKIEFDSAVWPPVPQKIEALEEEGVSIKTEQKIEFEPVVWPPVQQKTEAPEVIIDYKRLYFTSDETPELKLKSYFTSNFDSFPYIQRRYHTKEHKSFPCFERKNFIEEPIPVAEIKYLKKHCLKPSVPRKYMTSDDVFVMFESKYYKEESFVY